MIFFVRQQSDEERWKKNYYWNKRIVHCIRRHIRSERESTRNPYAGDINKIRSHINSFRNIERAHTQTAERITFRAKSVVFFVEAEKKVYTVLLVFVALRSSSRVLDKRYSSIWDDKKSGKGIQMNLAGQTINDRLLAARHSLAGQGLAKSVCKATTEEMIGPKKKHLDCKWRSNCNIFVIQLCVCVWMRIMNIRYSWLIWILRVISRVTVINRMNI